MENEHRLTALEEITKSNKRRIDKLEERQNNLDELVGTVKVLVDREERVETDVKEIKKDVKILTDKPAKRWDSLVNQIITGIAAAVLGFVLAKLGLG